jgi:hypothetical protein
MRRQARKEFEERFQPEQNYRQLMRIYETARARAEGLALRRAGVQ